MKKEDTKESENPFGLDANIIDISELPEINAVSLMNALRQANVKMESWMPMAIDICNGLAIKEGIKIDDLRKANQFITERMKKSEKSLNGNDYLKAFGIIMSKNGVTIKMGDVEYTARRICENGRI